MFLLPDLLMIPDLLLYLMDVRRNLAIWVGFSCLINGYAKAGILLTPFRTQSVPPPMSAYQLSLAEHPSPASSAVPVNQCRTPIHASFSSARDVLAVLWESGRVELWDLHTRIGPGRGRVMEPNKMWAGLISEDPAGESRQVTLWTASDQASDGLTARIVVLGSEREGCDILAILELEMEKVVHGYSVRMPGRNGRLVTSDEDVVWQAPDGKLFDGMSY